jgi:hypothetical protein
MEEKESTLKSTAIKIVSTVIGGVLTALIISKVIGDNASLSKDERNDKILATLQAYSTDVNQGTFDAYKYFTPKVERFYQMFDTSPKKINDYVNGLFYKQFQNATMNFDNNTLSVTEKENGEYEALIIMYSTYFNVKEKRQYTNHRTRTELRFDSNFHIKYFRQFFD